MAFTIAQGALEDVEATLRDLDLLAGRARIGDESLLQEDEHPAARVRLGSEDVTTETQEGIERRERDIEVRIAAQDPPQLHRLTAAVQAALRAPTWSAPAGKLSGREWRLTSVTPGEASEGGRRLHGEVFVYRLSYWTPEGDPTQEV